MEYFTDIEEIAKENDIGIAETEFQSVDGMCLGGNKGYLVLVDSRLTLYRRRWTIAHELFHIADDTVNS
jgi:Zn-dependent peptidase ImmA (M78 family)